MEIKATVHRKEHSVILSSTVAFNFCLGLNITFQTWLYVFQFSIDHAKLLYVSYTLPAFCH